MFQACVLPCMNLAVWLSCTILQAVILPTIRTDEIRWYDQDSLIYISGLTEIDAVMGNDAKFIYDIEETARELKPKFIALAGSPIPFMNGTDFPCNCPGD